MNKLQVLEAFQAFYCLLLVYNSSEFCGKDRRTKINNALRAFGISMLLFDVVIVIISILCYCMDPNNSLNDFALPLPIGIAGAQALLIYFSIGSNCQTIVKLIQRVQQNINDRRFLAPFAWILIEKQTISIFVLFCFFQNKSRTESCMEFTFKLRGCTHFWLN